MIGYSRRAACGLLGLSRRAACYELRRRQKDGPATSQRFRRFSYHRMTAWLRWEKRTRRLLAKPGSKRRPRRRRCNSDIRLPAAITPNSVWTYDIMRDRLASGTALKCVLDGHTRNA